MLAAYAGHARPARPHPRWRRDLAQRDRHGLRASGSGSAGAALPIPEVVANACAFLGLDPLQVANEGKLLAFVPPGRPTRCSPRCGRTRPGPAPGHRRVRGGPPRHGVDDHRLRGLARRRPAHRRAAPADLLMKFLVLWNLEQSLLSDAMVRAIARMPEYGGRLEEQGKVLMRYHIVGAHGGAWIYDVESHEEFERLLAVAPVFNFAQLQRPSARRHDGRVRRDLRDSPRHPRPPGLVRRARRPPPPGHQRTPPRAAGASSA